MALYTNKSKLRSNWLQAPDFLKKHYSDWNSANKIVFVHTTSTSKRKEPVIDPTRFRSRTKLLLTLTTIYNLLLRIKKERNNKEQYTADINQAHSQLIRISQDKVFHSAIHSLRRGRKLDSKCKIRSLNPYLDKNGTFRSQGRLQFSPEGLQLAKLPIIPHAKDSITRLYLEHAHRICIHQGTEAVKAFVQQRYVVISVRKTLLSIRFRCFLCHRFEAHNIQPLMAPLPECRFPDTLSQFLFANRGIDFFGPFHIEDTKDKLTKYYGLIFTCMVTRAANLESCSDLNRSIFSTPSDVLQHEGVNQNLF